MAELLLSEEKGVKTFLVENTKWGPEVIRKVLDQPYPTEKQVREFLSEYKLLKELNIKGLRKPIDSVKEEEKLVTYYEYFDGFTLKKLIETGKNDLDLVLNTGIFLADTLIQLHKRKVIHKNISSNNIIYHSKSQNYCLIDFSSASTIKQKKHLLGGTDIINGDLNYISPEQTGRINRQVDHRSDLYSIGIVLYELVTGVLPFSDNDVRETIYGHIAVIPTSPAQRHGTIPEKLSEVIMKLIEKDADYRYQSAVGLKKDLQRIQTELVKGQISDFSIGEYDKSITLTLSQKLYGRESEILELTGHLEEIVDGGFGVDMVYGYSGSGKSSLVHEVYKTLAKTKGYFISGKFDQLQRNIPYYAIRQALTEYFNILVTEDGEYIDQVRQKILEALGDDAALIIEIIPELEHIIGRQPKPIAASGTAGQNRFNYVFNNFLRAITESGQPIILFIDDLQWADLASLNLITNIIHDRQLKHLLFIGSFRDNEVSDAHPLMQLIHSSEKEGINIRHIRIGNLSNNDINNLLSDSLNLPEEEVKPLAKRLFLQTDGNAFYTIQIIQNLYEQGYLFFDEKEQRWLWDDKVIGEMEIPDNIVDLMIQRINRLDSNTQELLKKGSCFGNSFIGKDLELLLSLSSEEYESSLINAQEEGFIVEDQESFRFIHDRIQQAVYSLIPAHEQKRLHFEIGLRLLNLYGENSEKIFDVVDQLNFGIDQVENDDDRLKYALLNLEAGKLAIASTAYDAAKGYLDAGLLFLSNSWKPHYELILELHTHNAEAAYLLGNYDQVLDHIQEVLENATNLLDKIPVFKLQIEALKSQNDLYAAVEKGLEVLTMLDVKLPYKPSQVQVFSKLATTRIKMLGKSPESLLDLKKMDDPYMLAAMQVLVSIGPAIYWASPNLTPLTIFRMLLISVKYGNTDESTFAYSTYGLLLCGITGEIELGNRFGELTLNLAEQVNPINRVKGVFNVYCFVHHWSHSLSDSFKPFKEAYGLGLAAGDLEFSALSAYLYCNHAFYSGMPLRELDHEFKIYSDEIRRIKQYTSLNYSLMHWQTALNLIQDSPNPVDLNGAAYEEKVMVDKHLAANDKTALFKYHLLKMMLNYLFGNVFQAYEHGLKGSKYIDAVTGMYVTVAFHFYYGLVNAAKIEIDDNSSDQRRAKKVLAESIKKFKHWSKHSPVNNKQKYELLQAESARVSGQNDLAKASYKCAIESAKENKFVNDLALSYELAGKYYEAQKEQDLAQFFLTNAYTSYEQWGAITKSKELKIKYKLEGFIEAFIKPFSKQNAAGKEGNLLDKLDITSITEAAESISDEIQFDQLKSILLKILAENAGAEKADLLLIKEKQAVLEDSWPDSKNKTREYPEEVVDKVLKDGEILVTDRALDDSKFNSDPYIVRNKVRSALCLPLFHQNDLLAIIYLENNVVYGAFSPHRLEFLKLLSGQIAIAIKNASLYQNLTEAYDQQVQLKDAYSKFVPMDFLNFLGKDSILDIKLGDQIQEVVTIMFIDIVDYTSMSEKMTPKENFDFINGSLRRLGPALRKYGGVISQFMGDGAMAIFKDEPDKALLAGIEMQNTLREYNLERQPKDRKPVRIGVGIHTGKVMLGILGEQMRMDQNVISDAVNIASRVQDLTRIYDTRIMLTGTTKSMLKNSKEFAIRNLGETNIKGRKKRIEIYECLDGLEENQSRLKLETAIIFDKAITQYYEKNYETAIDGLENVIRTNPYDKAAILYLQWCREALEKKALKVQKEIDN